MNEQGKSHEYGAQDEQLLHEAKTHAVEVIQNGIEAANVAERIIGAPLVAPAEKRDETPLPEGAVISRAQERAVRAALLELGLGAERDLTLEEAGLPSDTAVVIEFGQGHKVDAEQRLLAGGPRVFSATKYRVILDGERAITARLSGVSEEAVGATEYEMGWMKVHNIDNAMLFDEPLELGYVSADGSVVAKEDVPEAERGTLLQVGTVEGKPIYLFDVPRRYRVDEAGEPVLNSRGQQEYTQPNIAQQSIAFAGILGIDKIAVATSSTYVPSRKADVVRASYNHMKSGGEPLELGLIAYCPATLADVKGEEGGAIPGIAHILGEAYAARESLQKLQAEIENTVE